MSEAVSYVINGVRVTFTNSGPGTYSWSAQRLQDRHDIVLAIPSGAVSSSIKTFERYIADELTAKPWVTGEI